MIWILIGILVLLVICLSIANYAPAHFLNKYKKYNKIKVATSKTAGEFALMVVNHCDYPQLEVARIDKEHSDSYYYKTNTILLSNSTIKSNSVASFATVAHEFGHAIQYNQGNTKFKFFIMLATLTRWLSGLVFPLLISGAVLSVLGVVSDSISNSLLVAGLVIFVLTFLFKIITIIIEYDASKKGLDYLKQNKIFTKKELRIARRFLGSAGLTYVGSFLSSMLAWTFMVPRYKK